MRTGSDVYWGIGRGERNVALVSIETTAKALKRSLPELFRTLVIAVATRIRSDLTKTAEFLDAVQNAGCPHLRT
jgi:hypothetical protein